MTAHEVTLSFMDTLIALTYLLTYTTLVPQHWHTEGAYAAPQEKRRNSM